MASTTNSPRSPIPGRLGTSETAVPQAHRCQTRSLSRAARKRCARDTRPLNWRPSLHAMSSLDYYNIEELLTDEERAARDRARRFVQEEVMSQVVPCFRAGKFPDDLIPRMGKLGFYAPYLKEHGCAGLSYP